MPRLIPAVALALLALPACSDREIPLDEAPDAAAKAMKDKYPQAQVVKVEKENDGGTTVIEFTLKDGGRTIEAEFAPDGKFVKEEAEIAGKDVPAAVAAAFKEKYPDATPTKTERITAHGGEVKYEFDITVGGEECEVFFAPDGAFIEKKGAKKAEKE